MFIFYYICINNLFTIDASQMKIFELLAVGANVLLSWGQIIAVVLSIVLSLATIWKFITMSINRKINLKADKRDIGYLSEKIKSNKEGIERNAESIEKVEDLNRDTNDKVNDIWKFLVGKKIS